MSKSKENSIESIMRAMRAQYGEAAKSYWVYAEELCPCCQVNSIDNFFEKDVRLVSINAFMYREKSVLISYFLCGDCAKKIHALIVYQRSPLHVAIETTLIKAYKQYLTTLQA